MRTNTIDTTDVSFHGVRSVGCFQMTFFQPGQLIQGFQQGFHCVNLDLKDLMSAELF